MKPSTAPPARRPVGPAATTRVRRRVLVPALLLAGSFIGFAISIYLTFSHYRGSIPPCHVVRGCETVQTSSYSEILGIPLALLGTLYFTVMFYLAIGLLTSRRDSLVLAYKVLAYLGALAVIPLFLVQAVVLQAYCSWCLATEVVMLAMWAGSFFLQMQAEEDAGVLAPLPENGASTVT